MKKYSNKIMAMLLAVALVFSSIPMSAMAVGTGEASSVTEKYIDEQTGAAVASEYVFKSTEQKNPKKIDGYVYSGFTEEVRHVYSKEDMTYLYGKEFTNTAIAKSDNGKEVTATDKGISISKGVPEGSVGAKTVSKSVAQVGDTLTYSITLRNASTATAEWKNVEITDVIPDFLSFIYGSVQLDGRATSEYSYNATSKVLTLFAGIFGIGEKKTFSFDVQVEAGAQGKYITNTAIVSSEGRGDIKLPDTGVQIEEGSTIPTITKTASVNSAVEGDIYSYMVTLKNGAKATAAWTNVSMTDVIPSALSLISGSVTLNGDTTLYTLNGQSIEVPVGDLLAGEEAIIKFQVRVVGGAGTTIHNVAVGEGDNGKKTGTDDGVKVDDPKNGGDPQNGLYGSKTVDKTMASAGDKVTFTIIAGNKSNEVWKNAYVYDLLDTSKLTFLRDSVMIDGVLYKEPSDKWTYTDRQLIVYLGDIAIGAEKKVEFSVIFKNDAIGSTYINNAVIKGSDESKNVYVKSPEIMVIGGGDGFPDFPPSQIHYQLFGGFADFEGNDLNLWKPTENMRLDHTCVVGYRMMTDNFKSSVGNGSVPVPDTINNFYVRFMISHGVISAAEYTRGDIEATEAQIYRILNYAGANVGASTSASTMARHRVAELICDRTNRDKTPNTNGLIVKYFSDAGAYSSLINEVSNDHDYTMDDFGNEEWHTASWYVG